MIKGNSGAMRNSIKALRALAVLMAFSSIAFPQNPNDPNWPMCAQCRNQQVRAEERAKTANLPFDAQDLAGIWGDNQNRIQLDTENMPSMTPLGQAAYAATETEYSPDGTPVSNWKDPMLRCDPLGWPRYFTYNYGFELLQLPGRTIQFFEMWHTWRTIYTDGRPLPAAPDPRFLGYSVGRWEGDTFVVESNGFDERAWLSEDRRERTHGFTHSEQLRTVERYTRVDHNTLDVSLTIDDPAIFTGPWVTTGAFLLNPGTELWEDFCVPTEAEWFNREVLRPAANAAPLD
jgi:hypothetical protein